MAAVVYAPASTRPKPLLYSAFVSIKPGEALKKMCTDQAELGIGATGSGGARGMAVLDGLVATLEARPSVRMYCVWPADCPIFTAR